MILAALVLAVAWPKTLTVGIGGMSAEKREITFGCWHNPKSGYFLMKTMECDGAHTHILLTRDRRMIDDVGFEVARFGRKPKWQYDAQKVEDRVFPAATKHGIAIGASKQQVLARLGKPVRTAVRGKKGEFWCALYKHTNYEDKDTGQILRNTYVFKNGKLIEIAVNLDSFPGCGEDDRSDTGWPWTRF